MSIKIIAAVNKEWGIGNDNDLLFRIPEDMKRFRELTTGHYVTYGRRTLESLPNPLPNRINVVLTKDKNYQAPTGVFVMNSVEQIINHYNSGDQDKDIFVLGGYSVFKEFLPYADEVHLTYIDKEAEKIDTYFPYEALKQYFQIVGSEKHYSEEEECNYSFVTYRHK